MGAKSIKWVNRVKLSQLRTGREHEHRKADAVEQMGHMCGQVVASLALDMNVDKRLWWGWRCLPPKNGNGNEVGLPLVVNDERGWGEGNGGDGQWSLATG